MGNAEALNDFGVRSCTRVTGAPERVNSVREHAGISSEGYVAATRGPILPEHLRLQAARRREADWTRWGPSSLERQWATVREDYSRRATRGITSPRPRPKPGLPLGGRWAGVTANAGCVCPGTLEWTRPNPEGNDFSA